MKHTIRVTFEIDASELREMHAAIQPSYGARFNTEAFSNLRRAIEQASSRVLTPKVGDNIVFVIPFKGRYTGTVVSLGQKRLKMTNVKETSTIYVGEEAWSNRVDSPNVETSREMFCYPENVEKIL